jgi:signal transduction histidine kinase/ActR/RegA family two-component response regulator
LLPLHPLQARQLKRLGIGAAEIPSLAAWQAFLERICKSYLEADQDRYTLERSLTVSSREMTALHEGLRAAAAELERRVAERSRELEEAQARLVTSERVAAVGQLAAGVAHEVNNPLAYISANITFALLELSAPGGPAPEALRDVLEALADAKQGASRIALITRDLKIFSRADGNRREAVDVRGTLESCISMAWNEIRHRARLVRDLAATPLIEAHEGRLAQVFLNLLLNAAQAIPEGNAADHEIRVVTRTSGSNVTIEISDTGTGIAPEHMGRLFEPFFTTKPIGVGTGLGLSVCHGIIKSLGGTIEAKSVPGKGATFLVSLPIGNAWAADLDEAGVPATAAGQARVLLVDDDSMVLTAVKRILRDHHVTAIQDSREALSVLLADSGFDLILCDLMMPNLSGIELYEVLEKQAPRQLARFVFLTGGAFTPRAREFLERLQGRHIEKPFDRDALLALVASYVGRGSVEAVPLRGRAES